MSLEALQPRALAGDLAPLRSPLNPTRRSGVCTGLLQDFLPEPVWRLDGKPLPVRQETLTGLLQRVRAGAPGGTLRLEARADAGLDALTEGEGALTLSRLDTHHAVVVDLLVCHGDPRTDRALAGRAGAPRRAADGRIFHTARHLSEAGVEVNLVLAPLLPGVNDRAAALDELFERGREAGVADVTAAWLDLASGLSGRSSVLGAFQGPWQRAAWLRRLRDERPALVSLYERLYDTAGNLRPLEAEPLATRFAHFRALHGFPRRGLGDYGRG